MPDSSPPEEEGLLCSDCGAELWVQTFISVRGGLEFQTFCPHCDVAEPPEDVITPDDNPDA